VKLEISIATVIMYTLQQLPLVLADRTHCYTLSSSCRPSVCPSVCNAMHSGSQSRCTGL